VSGFEGRSCPINVAAWVRGNKDTRVTRFKWRDAADRAMQPISHRAQGVMVETCHLAGIDSAVRQHGIPPLPDRRRSHVDRIEPRGAVALQQQAIRVIEVSCRR